MPKEPDIDQGGGTFARPGKKKKHLKPYTTLYESNFRDVAKTLRTIAKDVEKGKYGNVNEAALVFNADKEEEYCVFGFGPQTTGIYSTMVLFELGIGELRAKLYDAKMVKAALNGSDK